MRSSARLAAVLYCVLLVTRVALGEYQLDKMPRADLRRAVATLADCSDFNNRMANETAQCVTRASKLAQSTRCRSLNAHLEMAEARLDRLDEFVLLRQLESVRPLLEDCTNADGSGDVASELAQLEEERRRLKQAVEDAAREIEEHEERDRAIVRETDALREEAAALECELKRLETEQWLLGRQLQLQATALQLLSGASRREASPEASPDLTIEMEAVDAEQTHATERCRRQTEEHRLRLDSCHQEEAALKSELELLKEQELSPDVAAALLQEMIACHTELGVCAATVSDCTTELETASTELIQREMAALAERGRLQGCQRELVAGRGRFGQCRDSARALRTEMSVLQHEVGGTSAEDGRLELCYSDSSRCGSRAATCAQKLSELHGGQRACRAETDLWRERWLKCNATASDLEHGRLVPLQHSAQRLEHLVNETVELGRSCESDSLRVRADRGFAEEDLLRAKTILSTTKRRLDECQTECWAPEEEGAEAIAGIGDAGPEDRVGTDGDMHGNYDYSMY